MASLRAVVCLLTIVCVAVAPHLGSKFTVTSDLDGVKETEVRCKLHIGRPIRLEVHGDLSNSTRVRVTLETAEVSEVIVAEMDAHGNGVKLFIPSGRIIEKLKATMHGPSYARLVVKVDWEDVYFIIIQVMRPLVEMEAISPRNFDAVKAGDKVLVQVSFRNPYPVDMEDCELTIIDLNTGFRVVSNQTTFDVRAEEAVGIKNGELLIEFREAGDYKLQARLRPKGFWWITSKMTLVKAHPIMVIG